MRRWVKVSVAAAAVLGVGGWIAEPYARDWWLVRDACDGALPADAVRQLTPDGTHFTDAETVSSEELGDYRCSLSAGGDDGDEFLVLQAYTRRDDQDRRFFASFPESGYSDQAPMPDGLPGFIDERGYPQLLLRCPDLPKDDDGRVRRLLVRGWFARQAHWGHPAVYEAVTAFANSASQRLGCGAEPLKVPEVDEGPVQPWRDPETVPLTEAGDTACGWLTKAGLARPAAWRLASLMNDAAPTGRCDLFTEDPESDDLDRRAVFVAWYGDWSNRLVTDDDGERLPLTASARCDGEAAGFAVSADDEVPGLGRARQRELLETFARDQVRRRGCSELRLTG